MSDMNFVNRISGIFNFIWFFLMTLNSFYFYSLSMPVFSVISAILTVPLIFTTKISFQKTDRLPLVIFLYFLVCSILTALPNTSNIFLQRIIFFFLLLPVIIYSSYLFRSQKKMMKSIIKISLIVHLLFFYFQFFGFYLTGDFIDFLEPITGESQRALGGSYTFGSGGVKLIRATGLFNEPGTYSTFLFLIFLLFKGLQRDLGHNESLSLFDVILIISILLTFSVFGFIFVFLFSLTYIMREKLINKVLFVIALFPFAYLSIKNYLLVRFEKETTGVEFREQGVAMFWNHVIEEPFHFLLGYSAFVDFNELLGGSRIVWNDIGLFFVTFMTLGVIGIILLIIISIPRLKKNYLLILVTFMSKMSVTTIFLWVVITYIYRRERYVSNRI